MDECFRVIPTDHFPRNGLKLVSLGDFHFETGNLDCVDNMWLASHLGPQSMDLNLPVPSEDFIPVQNILPEVQFCEPKLLPIVSETVLEAEAKQQK